MSAISFFFYLTLIFSYKMYLVACFRGKLDKKLYVLQHESLQNMEVNF